MTNKQKKDAKEIFERNPKLEKLRMNPKGEFFTREDLAVASISKDERLITVSRGEISEPTNEADQNTRPSIAELKKQLEGVIELPIAEQMLLEEQNHDDTRKGAVKALEEKIEELKANDNGQS